MEKAEIEVLLVPRFSKAHVNAALGHFSLLVSKFQTGDWEPCISKAGKFVEATLKALYVHTGNTPARGRQFKVDAVINSLGAIAAGTFDDTIRLTIPRACRLVYDIASNRGARHDPDEIDPNEMDANVAVMNCSWILAEMIRFAQKGNLNMRQTQELLESLTTRKYPFIEEVDGRVYFHYKKLSAKDVAALTLAYYYPKRIHEADLAETIKRHHFKANNAKTAVQRIRKFADDDGNGNLRALSTCLRKADTIMTNN